MLALGGVVDLGAPAQSTAKLPDSDDEQPARGGKAHDGAVADVALHSKNALFRRVRKQEPRVDERP